MADDGAGIDDIIGAQGGPAGDMGAVLNAASSSDDDIGVDKGLGSDLYSFGKLSRGVNESGGMNLGHGFSLADARRSGSSGPAHIASSSISVQGFSARAQPVETASPFDILKKTESQKAILPTKARSHREKIWNQRLISMLSLAL
jgi:hypothetical protein